MYIYSDSRDSFWYACCASKRHASFATRLTFCLLFAPKNTCCRSQLTMSQLSRKRAYSESLTSVDETPEEEPEKLISDKDIIERLDILDSATRRKLLIAAAQSHLDVLRAVKAKTNAIYEDARSSTLNFEQFSKAVYKLTRCPRYEYDGGQLPKAFQADQADRVISKILRHLDNIERDSPPYASFATKLNALVTLGEICRYIVMQRPQLERKSSHISKKTTVLTTS